MQQIRQFDHINVAVSNQDTRLNWYEGLEIKFDGQIDYSHSSDRCVIDPSVYRNEVVFRNIDKAEFPEAA